MGVLALKVSGDTFTVGRGELTLGTLEPVVYNLRDRGRGKKSQNTKDANETIISPDQKKAGKMSQEGN